MTTLTTEAQVRDSFWDAFPQFEPERMRGKKQNDYRCDIRVAFVDYVDYLARDGEISNALAQRVTL